MRVRTLIFAAILASVSYGASATDDAPQTTPPGLQTATHQPNAGRQGMVAAEERRAAKVGADILAAGGNAVDAAAATGFALAVTYPAAGNIGGGGFMLIRIAATGETLALDYRETAPALATRDMYLNENGELDTQSIWYTHKASGVPGTVAGLLHAHQKYGKLPLKQVMAPAIALAEKGYRLNFYESAMIADSSEVLNANAAAAKTFFKPDGALYMPGDQFSRPLLAKTLKEVSKRGRDGFYKGWVADAIADDMAANGGLITREDLANYEPVEREALTGTYRGYGIVGFPPPSSGGALLIQMLNMLEARPPMSRGDTASELHYLIEVMRRAYADRAELMGDTDFVDVPVAGLIDKAYAATRAATIDESRASQSSDIREGAPPAHESTHTTHFSVIDADGNMVANTYTLNLGFGSGVVIPGTGIVMNNEMDDFAALVGMPNAYGLVMGERNAIEAGKRPLSSMTPTLILKDGAPYLALGAQGGSRIISAVLNTTLNIIDREMNLGEAIAQPRVHQQWLPDTVLYEEGMSNDTTTALEAMGHDLQPFDWQATVQGVMAKDGWYYGYSDPRIPGGAACAPDAGC